MLAYRSMMKGTFSMSSTWQKSLVEVWHPYAAIDAWAGDALLKDRLPGQI